MSKILLMIILASYYAFAECYYSSKRMKGDRVVVKRGDLIVYSTPCGDTKIINPLNVQRGGGFLSGGADVEVLSTISVTYTNHIWGWGHLVMNEPQEVSTVKNFPMNDYELDFRQESCDAVTYDLTDRHCVRK